MPRLLHALHLRDDGRRHDVLVCIPAAEDTGARADEVAVFRREMVYRVIAFVHCFRLHLRDQDRLEELKHAVRAAVRPNPTIGGKL